MVLPKSLKSTVLHELHNAPTSGHLGITRTLSAIKTRFFWFRQRHDVETWIRKCDKCTTGKTSPKQKRALLKQYQVGAPMERIAIDIAGPWPMSDSGNKYIMVVCDYFTKWVEAYPIPDQEAYTVAEKLVNEFIARYGLCRQLHTDQGSNFQSHLFREMCTLLDIDKTRTTPFHPASDGLVERFNRTMETMLRMYVSENQRDWDEKLPCLLMAYRATVHESTQCTPNLMMLGRETELPVDLMFGRPAGIPPDFDREVYYVDMLRDKLEKAHQYARLCLKKNATRQKRNYDHRVREDSFVKGEKVWLHTPKRQVGLSPKLQTFWDGPFTITLVIGSNTYKVQRSANSRTIVVHRDRLCKYQGDEPSWFVSDDPVVNDPPDPQAQSDTDQTVNTSSDAFDPDPVVPTNTPDSPLFPNDAERVASNDTNPWDPDPPDPQAQSDTDQAVNTSSDVFDTDPVVPTNNQDSPFFPNDTERVASDDTKTWDPDPPDPQIPIRHRSRSEYIK